MTAFFFLLLLATATMALSAGLVRWLITRIKVIDIPGERSSHSVPVPKGGGIGVMIAFFSGLVCSYFLPPPYGHTEHMGLILCSTGFIAIISWMDDIWQWPATYKFLAQGVAAVSVVSGGLTFHLSGPAPSLADPCITALWLVFIMNALNFMDGLNGLASGVCVLSSICLALLGGLDHVPTVVTMPLVLASAVAGFLPFNFPAAKIFLGDVGSQACGLLLGIFAIIAQQSFGPQIGFNSAITLVPLLVSGLLFDVTFTIIRRFICGKNLLQAHREHLYQYAHRAGMPAEKISLVEWSFVLWGWLCCMLLINGYSLFFIPPLALLPQVLWVSYVIPRARAHGIRILQ